MVINFFYNKQQPNADEGKVANYQNFLDRSAIFHEHPVPGCAPLTG